MKYEEYLRANGATEDEIKVLCTPTSERAFAKQQTDIANANKVVGSYKKWFDEEAVPAYKKIESELIVSRANEARAREAIMAARDRGLVDIAKDLGYPVAGAPGTPGAPVTPPVGTPPDLSRYMTVDQAKALADSEGQAIAQAYDIGAEHAILFPDKPLRMTEVRRSALSRGVSVEQEWMETYGVQAARTARENKLREDHENKIRTEERAKVQQEFADQYGNPMARPPVSSNSPFVARPNAGREKQPWEAGDRSAERVRRATQTVVEQSLGGRPAVPAVARPN
jgi:hypothetical protein